MARRSPLPLIMAAVVGVSLVVGVRYWFAEDPAPAPTRSDCLPLAVTASSEKAALLTSMAADYNRSGRLVAGRCVDVRVSELPSGIAAQALVRDWDEAAHGPRPDVWSPAARSWAELLAHRLDSAERPNIIPADQPSIAESPLVIAMPQPMAEALGWPQRAIGWSDLAALARDPQGWGGRGHPEWGPFKLGKTNPNLSTSGLDATVAAFFAATGRSTDLTIADVDDPTNRAFVRGVEGSVVHYGDTTLTFLQNLYDAAENGQALTYISAVAVEEKSVWDYNQGNPSGDPATMGQRGPPRTKLVAIYPQDGTLISDNPFLTLTGDWVDDSKRAAAADVLAFLREPTQQQRFQAAAFRSFDGTPGPLISPDNGMPGDQAVSELAPPGGAVLDRIVAAWSDLRKRANLVVVLDVSGSMGEAVPGTGRTRLDLAKVAAEKGLELLGREDTLSLWKFSSPVAGEKVPYRELVPAGQVETIRNDYLRAIDGLQPAGNTALYATTRAAVAQVQSGFDPNRINAVMVLTDGVNEYPPDNDLDGLIQNLDGQDRAREVRVFAIAYGPDASLEILTRIAKASTAAAYDASQTTSIETVMTNVISNF
jgi:Ca-activated chloride channel homolog